MKAKDLKHLSRADLLEMLIEQSKELQEVREKLQQAEEQLKNREIVISNAGSIAEASLRLNGVFEAAQAACREYVENTRKYCEAVAPESFLPYEPSPYVKPVSPPPAREPYVVPPEPPVQQPVYQPQPAPADAAVPVSAVRRRSARYMSIVNEMERNPQ